MEFLPESSPEPRPEVAYKIAIDYRPPASIGDYRKKDEAPKFLSSLPDVEGFKGNGGGKPPKDKSARKGANAAGQKHPFVMDRRKARELPPDAASRIAEFKALAQRLLQKKEEQGATISRELHDNVAQVLTAATTRISLANEETMPAWLHQELLDLREQLESALDDVRSLARELRPALLDHCGFGAAIEKHAEGFRQRSDIALEAHIDSGAAEFLESEHLTHLFRIAQEALQNVEEHSRAARAWIELARRDGAIHLEIGDDGCAFTAARVAEAQADGHLGLLGMRERAELLGGSFLLESSPGTGTVVRVSVPVPPPPRKNRSKIHS